MMRESPQRTSSQVIWDQFVKNVQNMASWDRYKDAHRQAMLMWQESKKSKFSDILMPKPLNVCHIIRTVNLNHLSLPSNNEVKNATVRKYIDLEKEGDSLKKRGRLPRIPDSHWRQEINMLPGCSPLVASVKQVSEL